MSLLMMMACLVALAGVMAWLAVVNARMLSRDLRRRTELSRERLQRDANALVDRLLDADRRE